MPQTAGSPAAASGAGKESRKMPDGPMVSPIQRQKVKRTRKPSLVSGLNADWTAIIILLLTEHLLFQVLCTHSQQSCVCVCVCELLSQVQLCDPANCSPPASSVRGILQARTLEWVAISFPLGLLHNRQIFYHLSPQGILQDTLMGFTLLEARELAKVTQLVSCTGRLQTLCSKLRSPSLFPT